jgi:hypothetical protein
VPSGDPDVACGQTSARGSNACLGENAAAVVLTRAGRVGDASLFLRPVSRRMTWRARRLHGFVREAAARHGAACVNLCHQRSDDPFAKRPELDACARLHSSDPANASASPH